MASLQGPLLKLERASEHLKTLDAEVVEFLEGEPYRTIETIEPETGDYVLSGEILRPPPAHLGPIIGDIVHNLRSALDHLAYQLAIIGKDAPGKVRFPIFLDPGPGRNCFDPWGMNQIKWLPERAKVLIEEMQPYNAGQAWLWTLHSMWLTDKHKLLPVVLAHGAGWVSWPAETADDAFDFHGDFIDQITWNTGVFQSGDELLRISTRLAHLRKEIKPHLKFDVAVEVERPPFVKPVVELMRELHDHVRYGTFRKFEQFFTDPANHSG